VEAKGEKMLRKHNKELVPFAKELRKNMTKEEKHLWYDFLCNYPVRFTRQKVLGRYIADFYCAEAKVVIELDGSGHYTAEGKEYDAERTAFLEKYDLVVVRILNADINKNFRGVCLHIDKIVKQRLHIGDNSRITSL
jgi:very-short-patch-repair endonuclease